MQRGKRWALLTGDCRDIMRSNPENSVDSIVCDPPYGLEFMGKEWDRLGDTRQPFRGEVQPGSGPFGRTPVRYGGYTTGAGRRGKPGIGERETEWVSNRGWNDHRCRTCGHLGHGGSPCTCENPDFGPADDRWRLMQAWHESWAVEAIRVLKPGGYLLAFGGTRTFHRLTCAIEDAGFEVRDCLTWLHGQGLPKNGISCKCKGEREPGPADPHGWATCGGCGNPIGLSATLRPAWEPIVVARKPCAGTAEVNVARYGTGKFNVDGCRLGEPVPPTVQGRSSVIYGGGSGFAPDGQQRSQPHEDGRWPPNVLLDEDAAADLDASVPPSRSRKGKPRSSTEPGLGWGTTKTGAEYDDAGGPSRFMYVSKASRRERDAGLESLPLRRAGAMTGTHDGSLKTGSGNKRNPYYRNEHPTVKPVLLMRWLVRLATPPRGLVYDPFVGSGSTGIACVLEGRRFVGTDLSDEYVQIAAARIRHVERHGEEWLTEKGDPAA